jgi:hypothetical protein
LPVPPSPVKPDAKDPLNSLAVFREASVAAANPLGVENSGRHSLRQFMSEVGQSLSMRRKSVEEAI